MDRGDSPRDNWLEFTSVGDGSIDCDIGRRNIVGGGTLAEDFGQRIERQFSGEGVVMTTSK